MLDQLNKEVQATFLRNDAVQVVRRDLQVERKAKHIKAQEAHAFNNALCKRLIKY